MNIDKFFDILRSVSTSDSVLAIQNVNQSCGQKKKKKFKHAGLFLETSQKFNHNVTIFGQFLVGQFILQEFKSIHNSKQYMSLHESIYHIIAFPY